MILNSSIFNRKLSWIPEPTGVGVVVKKQG